MPQWTPCKSARYYRRSPQLCGDSWKGGAVILGRDAEVSVGLAAVRRHAPVAIHGEIGIGKTATARAVVVASGLTAHAGGALATLSWFAGLPLARAIRRPL